MDRMIAYCGLVCSECGAYRATVADDRDELQKMADKWAAEFGTAISPDDCRCMGCPGERKPRISYVDQCGIRACATGRGLEHCGACGDYACERLLKWFEGCPQSRATLDSLRSGAV